MTATQLIYRHKLATRLWHWVNALALVVLLMSGLMIFNAHPRLYWGHYGSNPDPAWLEIRADDRGGYVKLGQTRWNTDGVLGRWTAPDGAVRTNAFPHWATIPSGYDLALARRWHLTFALVLGFGLLVFLIASLINRHVQKDLALRRAELTPRHLWHDLVEHLKLRFHDPNDPGAFNILQKLSYVGVIFVLIPLVIFTGLAMSPGMNAGWGWLVELFGGRQSARSIHFIVAGLLSGFVVVHLVLVLLSGPINGLRGMITGWLRVPETPTLMMLSRRHLIGSLAAGGLLSGCDRLGQSETVRDILFSAEDAHRFLQRSLTDRAALAKEFGADQMSPVFRTNGTNNPGTPAYQALAAGRFADYRLVVDGQVARPLSLSLAQIRSMPRRDQITRHDCVEGWSAIGQWHGVPLKRVLEQAGLRSSARYIVFHCADLYGARPYYESVDLIDAFHPQTILAWGMNGRMLDIGHGAPLRLRAERHLGYKHAKYVMRVEAVTSLAGIHGGKGGLWEDLAGYEWYAGI